MNMPLKAMISAFYGQLFDKKFELLATFCAEWWPVDGHFSQLLMDDWHHNHELVITHLT